MVTISLTPGRDKRGKECYTLIIKAYDYIVYSADLPDDSSESLFEALLKTPYPSDPRVRSYDVEDLIRCLPDLLDSYDSADGQKKKVIDSLAEAVDRFLDAEDRKALRESCREEYRRLKSFLYQFDVREVVKPGERWIEVRFRACKTEFPPWSLSVETAERRGKDPVVSKEGFHDHLIKDWQPSSLEELHSFTHFAEGLEPKPSLVQCYKNLAKALIEFCEHRRDAFLQFHSLIPRICAFVIMVEEDEEQEKHYLDRIVLYERRSEERQQLFEEIVAGIDVDKSGGRNKQKRVINHISSHYLRLYDLKRAADFFDKLSDKGLVYKSAIFIYRYILPIFGTFFLLLCISFLFPSKLDTVSRFLIAVALGVSYLLVFGLLAVSLFKREIHYMRLVFPRLLGAIVVGLCILAPQDLPWKWGLIDWGPLTLICAITYLAAFAYVYLEVETTLRPTGMKTEAILESGLKIYLIGLLEAILATTVVTSLLSSAMRDINPLYGEQAFFLGSFALYPRLIVVWAGIALFVAGFAQLLWQGRRITESI